MANQRAEPGCEPGQVMLTFEDKGIKRFTWAIAPALASLGYLFILVVSIFPFWVRLVDEESHEVFFSGLFENCFHIKCLKPRPLSIYIFLGRIFLLSAVVLAFLTTFFMVSFASDLFWRIRRPNIVSAFISFLTGAICLSQEATCCICQLLPIFQSTEETQGISHLESFGEGLNSVQKEMLLQEETVI
ncbi:transmembrane protein 225B isoform X3 [Fukomys damarensis]|uniref:transmembrane protein 225B isoform X3 n=1 Tax=Fukomys damarensis TaxID=885580 RepID=UPI0008FF4BB4|nr:transmembrane protein 225B isoform X3 [Fukomys damarensis]